jgi:transketolase
MNKKSTNVYVVIGDGECNEGSIWEAAMSAPHFELNNLIVILDNNSYQQTGHNNEIMNTDVFYISKLTYTFKEED